MSAVGWFLGLSGLYALYAAGTYFGLHDDLLVGDRLGMVLGPTMVALSLLIAPAAFAAAATRPFLIAERERRALAKHVAQLILFALGAYALCTVGPRVGQALLHPPTFPLPSVAPAPEILENARFWVPSSISVFAIFSGVAGGLIGRITEGWCPRRQAVLTWFSCLAVFLSFWLSFLLTINLVLQRGVSTPWLLPGSLLLPTLLIGVIVWRTVDDVGWKGRPRGSHIESDPYDPEYLDRVDSVVNPQVGRLDEDLFGTMVASRSELEMVHMAKGLRRELGPDVSMSPQRVDEIVESLMDVPEREETRPTSTQRIRNRNRRLMKTGEFCTSWSCLALGMLMVGMLGGVPPNLVLAGLAGLLGSAAILVKAAGNFRLAR